MMQKNIENNAINYLTSRLEGMDHKLIHNELDKLSYFVHDKEQITISDAQKVIHADIATNGDDLCIYFAQKNLGGFLAELTKLQKQNISEVLIIRALLRYYVNLYIVLLKTTNGSKLDEACLSIRPPIFFKKLNDFKRIVTNLSLQHIIATLSILQYAEIDFKLYNNSFDFYHNLYMKHIQNL
jgi:DNA polymerase-3 subunit delta